VARLRSDWLPPGGDRQSGSSLVREASSKSSKHQLQIGDPKSLAFYGYLAAPWSRQGRSDGSSRPRRATGHLTVRLPRDRAGSLTLTNLFQLDRS
jgi:hypothetical protein